MTEEHSTDPLIACIRCDALSSLPQLYPGQTAHCPSCGCSLFSRKKDSIERTLAISIAGLLLFIPAISLPIMTIGMTGFYHQASLLDCVMKMIEGEFYIIAFCVFMFTIAIPTVRLFSAFYLTFRIKFGQISPSLLLFFRSYHLLDNWTMIHVFFLGIVISMYKLVSLADLNIGGGLVSLLLLLLCSTLVTVTLDQHYIWQKLERESVSKR